MTDFKPNVTKSIDNLNNAEKNIDALDIDYNKVFSEETEDYIDSVLENNIDTESGTDITLQNTVENGKIEYSILGNTEQDTTAYIDVGTWEQGGIDGSNGQNINDDTVVRTAGYIEVKPNVLYNISRNLATGYMGFRFYNSNKQYLGSQATEGMVTTDKTQNRMQENETSMTLTINNTNVAYMRMNDNSNDLSIQYTISTQAPTPDYPQDVKVVTGDNDVVVCNKNLLNLNDLSVIKYNVGEMTINDNNVIVEPGITGNVQIIYKLGLINTFIGKTLTFSIEENNNSEFAYCGFVCIGNNINELEEINPFLRENKSITITIPNTNYQYQFLGIRLYKNGAISGQEFIIKKPMVELGSTATSYIAHQEQSTTLHLGSLELCKIGNYQDYITGSKDNWKVVKQVGKVVLNGSENWSTFNTNYVIAKTDLVNADIPAYSTDMLCDYFTVNSGGGGIGSLYAGGSNLNFNYYNAVGGVENFKTWLSNNNVTLYYPLATPTEETITDTTLISDLNDLYDANLYEDETNISNSGNLAAILDITYFKKGGE